MFSHKKLVSEFKNILVSFSYSLACFQIFLLRFKIFSLFVADDGENQWPDILKFLFECCNSQSNEIREIPLQILW